MFDEKFTEEWILQVEGGYVNSPEDPGGETKYGISKRSFPNLDIKNLTIEQAVQIYKNVYWNPLGLDNLDFPEAFVVFDMAINQGVSAAVNNLKECLFETKYQSNNVISGYRFTLLFMSKRIKAYASYGAFKYFGEGWMNRCANVMEKYIQLKGIK